MEWGRRGRARGWWALTGTPGTGKSRTARALAPELPAVELGDLALGFGGRTGAGRTVEVDLPRLARFVRQHRPPIPVVIAGHLAHRLPVDGVIVLRAHPRELDRRLRHRRDPPASRVQNVGAEALDLISAEVRAMGSVPVELDTTAMTPAAVARRVVEAIAGLRGSDPSPDWLADPDVPAFLLSGAA